MKARFGCAAASGIPGLLLCLLALSLVRGARPAEPLSLTGPITSFDRAYPGCGKCFSTLLPYNWDAYKVSLKATADGSSGPLWLHTGEFHPAIPDAIKQPGLEATMWYDRRTNDLIGLAVSGQRYSMEYLNRPRAKYWDGVGLGVLLGLPGLLLLFLALGIGLLWRDASDSQADPTADDQAQAYGYIAFFFYGVTAFIGFIVASIRWGSMPFWGLVIGGVLSIGVAIAEGPLIERLAAAAEVRTGWIPKVKSDLSLLSLVVFPVGAAVILTIALTFAERQL